MNAEEMEAVFDGNAIHDRNCRRNDLAALTTESGLF